MKWSRDGGLYFYISDEDRELIAKSLAGRPLLVITESSYRVSSMDALLPGPGEAFRLRYVVCPPSGDWVDELRRRSGQSNRLALIHNGRNSLMPGLEFPRPGSACCPEIPRALLEEALVAGGWSRYREGRFVDLWLHP
jgi:hypothetical protein